MKATVRHQDQELYAEIVRRIVAVADPDKIILFGSRARGDHRPESDVDILVIKDTAERPPARSRGLFTALATLPLDVQVCVRTQAEIDAWRGARQAFERVATREGVVLYERQP